MFTGDLTSEQGKQDYENYIMNNVRNEINSYTKQTQINNASSSASGSLALSAIIPTGTINAFGGVNLPSGYLWCDGTQQLIASYPSLWVALGVNRYGVDTATQFFLPNLTSHLPRGAATTGGAVTTNNNNSHGHGITNVNNATSLAHNHNNNGASTSSTGDHNHNNNGANTGGNDNNNTFRFPAAGTLITVANAGHTHGVNGSNTIGTGGHNHNVNGASTASNGGDLFHSHLNTVNDNTTYVPAFVEVNYIIKT